MTFRSGCSRPNLEFLGRYGPGDRGRLINEIGSIETTDRTPLAGAITSLPQIIGQSSDPDKPINVILLSDGQDSCGGDPCAAARSLKRRFPNVYISVISISTSSAAVRCVADETDGNFLESQDAGDISSLLRQATGLDPIENCAGR